MVSAKLRPPVPNSQALRATVWRGEAASTSRSPASFVWPYTDSGPVGSDSTYARGAPAASRNASPLKT